MPATRPDEQQALAVFDDRAFFARALSYGVRQGIIDRQRLSAIADDGAKGLVQIADHFGTKYLRPSIEQARDRLINLVSLYLEQTSGGDLERAACSLRDDTFLSHSRGGSEMLKRLWAMPEDTSLGIPASKTQKQFLAEWSLRGLADYRQLLAQRQRNETTLLAALRLAEELGETQANLWAIAVETLIRSALLVHLGGEKAPRLPDAIAFVRLLTALRKKGVGNRARKRLLARLETLPETQRELVRHQLRQLEDDDLPLILDPRQPLEHVMHRLQPLYWLRDSGPDEASEVDAMVAKDWQKITRGKTDDHSLLTVFLCLATGTPAQPTLTRKAARTMIQKARGGAWQPPAVSDFIRNCAPHAMQADLETLWNDFLPDATRFLLDAGDTTLGEAMAFLDENCMLA